jgi:hypothetical protein
MDPFYLLHGEYESTVDPDLVKEHDYNASAVHERLTNVPEGTYTTASFQSQLEHQLQPLLTTLLDAGGQLTFPMLSSKLGHQGKSIIANAQKLGWVSVDKGVVHFTSQAWEWSTVFS